MRIIIGLMDFSFDQSLVNVHLAWPLKLIVYKKQNKYVVRKFMT